MNVRRTSRRTPVLVCLAMVAALLVAGAPSATANTLTSDDFSGSTLDGRWRVVDTVGDGSVTLTGQGSNDAVVALALPAGSSHDAWKVNRSLRLLQPVSDADLAVTAKFDSVPIQKFQTQGLLVQQDESTWLRFDVYHDGSGLRAFAASTVAGTSTQKLKKTVSASGSVTLGVTRSGSDWTMTMASGTGAPTTIGAFTQDIQVSAAGPFVSNNGSGTSAPAFTALVDYVFDSGAPIDPEDAEPGPGPSVEPSAEPSLEPSAEPSAEHTAEPTTEPSAEPTTEPSSEPSSEPTTEPSAEPSAEPTTEPSAEPTTEPSAEPSAEPTTEPSVEPDPTPQPDPSEGPTPEPTEPISSVFGSDDFSGPALGSAWQVVNPVADGAVVVTGQGTGDARAEMRLPAGVSHDAWGINRSLRLMQQVPDVDLEIEAKYDSVPTSKFQGQGLLFEQDADDWLRFDVYHDGSKLYAYAASTTDGTSRKSLSRVISASSSVRIVVERTGSTWQMWVATDGGGLVSVGTLTRSMTLSAAGPFASNHGSGTAVPAWTSNVDYVFDSAAPVVPEDGGGGTGPVDSTPPVVSGLQATAAAEIAAVGWSTNEPTTGVVQFGTTTSLGSQVASSAPASAHSVTLSGLVPQTTYHYRLVSTDLAGNTRTTPTSTFTTSAPEPGQVPAIVDVQVVPSANGATVSWTSNRTTFGRVTYGSSTTYGSAVTTASGTSHAATLVGLSPATTYHFRVSATAPDGLSTTTSDAVFQTSTVNVGPVVDLWYGEVLQVGPSKGQEWVNIMGRATDPDGVASLTVTLPGQPTRALTLGPDNRRLQKGGDFNADIPWDVIPIGDTLAVLTATDSKGAVTIRNATIRKVAHSPATLPFTRSWTTQQPLATQALPVDGRWTIQNGVIRSVDPGYDRVVTLGDVGWTDYEMTVAITPVSQGPDAFSYLSGAPLLGVGMRWNGHEAVDNKQPTWGFYGTGAYAWVRWYANGTKLEVKGAGGSPTKTRATSFPYGTTQTLKVRAQTLESGVTRYTAKLWPQGSPEPATWGVTIDEPDGPEAGSLALISHHLDATFGPVTVTPLTP